MNAPKISIVIATFNADATLERCLDSIREQTYRNYEVLVADGVSIDRTLEILRKRASELTLVISKKDRGIYDAWNKVVPRATGEWIFFLGSDDTLWDRDTLAKVAPTLETAVENVVYGKVAILLPDGEILNFEGEPWEKIGWKFRHEMTIPHQGTFQRRSLFETHGLFDPSFRICGDYDFLLRELKDHPAKFVPGLIVAKMAFGGVSSTYANVPKIISELERAQRANGIGFSIYVFLRKVRYHLRSAFSRIFGRKIADRFADLYRRSVGKPRLWGRFHN